MPSNPDTETTSAPRGLQSRAKREFVEMAGRFFQLLGLPRSTGQIYGLLYLSSVPLSLDDVSQLLSISKGSASTGTRHLLAWRAIKQVWVPGDRKDFFEAVPDIGAIVQGGYTEFVKPRLSSSKKRLDTIREGLEADAREEQLSAEDIEFCQKRLAKLERLQKKIETIAPIAEKLLF